MKDNIIFSSLYNFSYKSLRPIVSNVGEINENYQSVDLMDRMMTSFIFRVSLNRSYDVVLKKIHSGFHMPLDSCYEYIVLGDFVSYDCIFKNGILTDSGYHMFGTNESIDIYENRLDYIKSFNPKYIMYCEKNGNNEDYIDLIKHLDNLSTDCCRLEGEFYKSLDRLAGYSFDYKVYISKVIYLDCEYIINAEHIRLKKIGMRNFHFDNSVINYC